jgi:hypothetical protein
VQGEKMTNLDLNMVNSVLNVKASKDDNDAILNDLNLPQGKSIAQLIYEQKNKEENTKEENEEDTQQSAQ